MRLPIAATLLCGALLLPAGQISAQQTCEDAMRTLRILAEQYAASRARTEIEAAQTIAGLLKQIESMKADLEAAKKVPR